MDKKLQKKYGQAIRATILTKGWEYLAQLLITERTQVLNKLIVEKDISLIPGYQGFIQAIDLLLSKVDFYSNLDTNKVDETEDIDD